MSDRSGFRLLRGADQRARLLKDFGDAFHVQFDLLEWVL